MPRQIRIANVTDFTGGLNLRANGFQLADNESPDLLNVDVDPRGGFRLRQGVQPFGTALPGPVHSLLTYETTTGVKEVVAGVGTQMYRSTGGAWTAFGPPRSVAADVTGVTFKDRLYLQNGTDAPLRWNGTAAVSLGAGWNNNLEAPTAQSATGNMPIGKVMAVHQGSVWVANTREGGTSHPNRVRWSHPNFPEDYVDYHFIDIDTGSDGDVITALVPFGDRLLVFKRKSIHAIYGHGPDGYQIFPVSREVGAVSQDSVVNTDVGLFFFSWPEGVFLYNGKEPRWVFERLYPAIEDGRIPDAYQDRISLGWGNRRLWVSTPFSSVEPSTVFVLDPSLGKEGAWTRYSLAVGPFLEWKPAGADALLLAGSVGQGRVLKLDQDVDTDDVGVGPVHIASHYRTRFYDLRQPAITKRWKSPEIVMHRQAADTTLLVEAFHDYDPGASRRQFRVSTSSVAGTGTWGASKWGDGSKWAGNGSNRNEVARGSSLGSARSVSLKFYGPDENLPWGVDSIALKYVPKPPRS